MSINAEIEVFKRKLLEKRLARITPEQRAKFDRIYPNGPKYDQIELAIDICDRTIKKNEAEKPKNEISMEGKRCTAHWIGSLMLNDHGNESTWCNKQAVIFTGTTFLCLECAKQSIKNLEGELSMRESVTDYIQRKLIDTKKALEQHDS
jgi:hypothetical protein